MLKVNTDARAFERRPVVQPNANCEYASPLTRPRDPVDATEPVDATPWEELQDRIVLGAAQFLADFKKHAQSSAGAKAGPWGRAACDLQTIIRCVEKARQEPWERFKNRHGDGGMALILKLARERSGLTLSELARRLGLKPSTNISMTIKRYEHWLLRDRPENRLATQAVEMLNATI